MCIVLVIAELIELWCSQDSLVISRTHGFAPLRFRALWVGDGVHSDVKRTHALAHDVSELDNKVLVRLRDWLVSRDT